MIQILFLAANPTDQLRLQLRQEFDQLRHALDAAPHGRRFHLIQEFAVAADQLQELLVRHQPQIVHFSGHGSEEGLFFEAADGRSQRVAPATLRDLFAGFRTTVRCVVLNACYSQQHADAHAAVIDSVVGMSDALTDEAALAFAVAFYRALANGSALADAQNLGRNQLDLQGLDEAHKPHLLADRIDAEQVRVLDWDDTPPTDNRESVLFIPFLRKSATEFVGRDAELAELHEKLQQSQIVGVRPAAALTGLGGIGKTQLAVEYAYRYQASYPGGIFWINAADLNRVRSQLVETAERMGLRTDHNTTDNALLAGLVKCCQQQPATLLCFDNAPDAVILWRRLTQELNTATLGAAILITTRRRELPPNMAALDLRRLSDNTVRQLLGTARPDLLTDPDLPRLLERLGGLPLVVSLVANALQNSPDATIADYLAALAQHGEELVHEELDVRAEDYDLYRDVYTRTLLPVLREQWERLCQQPKSENAQLLLRIAGQLPEAAEIPIVRLGLLAGLQDEKVIKPLTTAVNTLWKLSLIEELKEDTIRLHPLVRNFAASLTPAAERVNFCTACAQRLATTYTNIERFIMECKVRSVVEVANDLMIAVGLLKLAVAESNSGLPLIQLSTDLQILCRILYLEAPKLQNEQHRFHIAGILQQLHFRARSMGLDEISANLLQALSEDKNQYLKLAWAEQVLPNELEFTLLGEMNWVINVDISTHNNRIVSITSNGKVNIWNLADLSLEITLEVPKYAIGSASVSRDGQYLIIGTDDGELWIWNLTSAVCEHVIKGHADMINSIALFDNEKRAISASSDRLLKIWNLLTHQLEYSLVGHTGNINDVVIFDNNRQAITASDDKSLIIWDLVTRSIKRQLIGHTSRVLRVRIIDNNLAVSISFDQSICIWNMETGKPVKMLNDPQESATALCIIFNKNQVIYGTTSGKIKIWDVESNSIVRTISGHAGWVREIKTMDNNQRLISASEDGAIRIWNLRTPPIENLQSCHIKRVTGLLPVSSKWVLSCSWGTLILHDVENGKIMRKYSDFSGSKWNISVSTGKSMMLYITSNNEVKLSNLAQEQYDRILGTSQGSLRAVALSDDGTFAAWTNENSVIIFDLVEGKNLCILVNQHSVYWLSFASNNFCFISGNQGDYLRVYDLEKQIFINDYRDYVASLLRALIFGGGQHSFWKSNDDIFLLYPKDKEPGQHSLANTLCRYSSSDKIYVLSTTSYDSVVFLWQLTDTFVKKFPMGHTGKINSACIFDHGSKAATVSEDHSLRIWDLHLLQEVASVILDNELTEVTAIEMVDKTLLIVGDVMGNIYCFEYIIPTLGR